LRGGLKCTLDLPTADKANFNFDRQSEFATYCALARTRVPVPEVYGFADDRDPMNLAGAGYILLEKLPGKPLAWHETSLVQKEKSSRQLTDIYVYLEQSPFSMLGSLQLSPTGLPEVGPAFFDYGSKEELVPCGPFSHSNDYYTAMILRQIRLIKDDVIAASAPLDQGFSGDQCLIDSA
jgi:hypothetical protein